MDQAAQSRGMNFGWAPKVRFVRQSERSECGLACIAMVASYYGSSADLAQLREANAASMNGTTLATLIRVAERAGLSGRPLRVELDELPKLRGPSIIHLDMNHFVVLSRCRRRKYEVFDPAVGRLMISEEELSRRFTGIALELSPTTSFKATAPTPKLRLKSLFYRTHGVRQVLTNVFMMAMLLELAGLAAPLLAQVTIDSVIATRDVDLLIFVGLALGTVILTQMVVSAVRSWSLTSMGLNVDIAWTHDVFNHLLRLPDSYFQKRNLGDVISRFESLEAIHGLLGSRSAEIVLDGLLAVGSFFVLMAYSPMLTLITILAFAVFIAVRLATLHIMQSASASQIALAARKHTALIDAIRGVTEVKLANARHVVSSRFASRCVDNAVSAARAASIGIAFSSASGLIFGAARTAVLVAGAILAFRKGFTPGMLIAYLAYSDQFTGRLTSLVDFFVQLAVVDVHNDRLSDVALAHPELYEVGLGEEPVDASVEFQDVSFRYSTDDPYILRHCSFRVESGENATVAGPSGCGKSTILKLLAGLVEPTEGAIRVGGIDIRRLGKRRLRELASVVMQDAVLFEGTLAENIAIYEPEADQERVERAAAVAAIAAEISCMPLGYRTWVGDMGSSLSGGQKQRVCIARAVYRQPKILLLDEATSHLDYENEERVVTNLVSLTCTRISVSHRPGAIASGSKVLLLKDGCIQASAVAPLGGAKNYPSAHMSATS